MNVLAGDIDSLKVMSRALRVHFGEKRDPTRFDIGQQSGHALTWRFRASEPDELLRELKELWLNSGLGEIEHARQGPFVTLTVRNCFDCAGGSKTGDCLCAFESGILKAIFDDKLGVESVIKETECCGRRFEWCRFEITLKERARRRRYLSKRKVEDSIVRSAVTIGA